jgi:hypothetical protein
MTLASKVDWGTVPTWISALVTVLAFSVAASVFFHDRRKHQRADARMVTVAPLDPDDREGDGHTLVVTNLAERHIFDVRVHFVTEPSPGRLIAGGDFQVQHAMGPGGGSNSAFSQSFLCGRALHAVSFEDADGVRWLRSLHGRDLVRLPRRGQPRRAVINGRSYRVHARIDRRVRWQWRRGKTTFVVADQLPNEDGVTRLSNPQWPGQGQPAQVRGSDGG